MRYALLVMFALTGAIAVARVLHRNRTLSREGAPATTLTWLSTWLLIALVLGVLAWAVALTLRTEGVITYDRNLDWWSLVWFAFGTLVTAVVYAVDIWKRVRKVNRTTLLPRPAEDEPTD